MMSRSIVQGLALGAAMLAAAAALKLAGHAGLVSSEMVGRGCQAITGLVLAVYANFIPKTPPALASHPMAHRGQALLRLTGWAYTVAGLVYAAASLFAPLGLSTTLSVGAVAVAFVLTMGCFVWVCLQRAPTPTS